MKDHLLDAVKSTLATNINCDFWEYRRVCEVEDRRLYLYGSVQSVDSLEDFYSNISSTSTIIEYILDINRLDASIEKKDKDYKRDPIRLYINSPGGEATEGFALISAMELSKTPIHTINMGECSSMAFLISIAGDKRFALPYSEYLMHDGSLFAYGSANKVIDQVHFEDRQKREVIKPFVLSHSTMTEEEYDKLECKELYMTAHDALGYGFVDEIVNDIDQIL